MVYFLKGTKFSKSKNTRCIFLIIHELILSLFFVCLVLVSSSGLLFLSFRRILIGFGGLFFFFLGGGVFFLLGGLFVSCVFELGVFLQFSLIWLCVGVYALPKTMEYPSSRLEFFWNKNLRGFHALKVLDIENF